MNIQTPPNPPVRPRVTARRLPNPEPFFDAHDKRLAKMAFLVAILFAPFVCLYPDYARGIVVFAFVFGAVIIGGMEFVNYRNSHSKAPDVGDTVLVKGKVVGVFAMSAMVEFQGNNSKTSCAIVKSDVKKV